MESKKELIKAFIGKKIEEKARLLGLEIQANSLAEDFNITGSGVLDSMDFMSLIVEVEEEFGVEVDFSNQDPEKFTTLNGFVECIQL